MRSTRLRLVLCYALLSCYWKFPRTYITQQCIRAVFYFLNKRIPHLTLKSSKKTRNSSAHHSIPLAYYMKLACVAGVRRGGRRGWNERAIGKGDACKDAIVFFILPSDFKYAKPMQETVKCLAVKSFRSFCFQVTWLTKYGHDYQKWWQPQIEETWPKINPRILRELKIWWLEVIHSKHFELFCS